MYDTISILRECRELKEDMTAFLEKLMRFPSVSGYEGPAMHWLHKQMKPLADVCEMVPVPESIVDDPDYAFRLDDQPYEGRPNVRAVLKGNGTGKKVIFNAHVDTVPPSKGQERPFDPFVRDGVIFGRGALDDKGQVAVLWTMLTAMKKLGIRPRGDIVLHIVIEEETGGNGTLSFIRGDDRADCCINLEPCNNNIMTSIRGAVWFTGKVTGLAGHSGSPGTTVSALDLAIEAMGILREYHDELLARTKLDDPLFAAFDNPMPLTFGQLNAGDWPAMTPEHAEFKGVLGLLTTQKEQVMEEMIDRVMTRGSSWLKDNFEMTFQYRHDTNRIDSGLPFVKMLQESYLEYDIPSEISALTGSTDAWFYTNQLGIPTLATGCGNIAKAHTKDEHIRLDDIILEAAVLMRFIERFSGMYVV